MANENVVAGEMVVQFGRLRRRQRSEQRRRFDLAERRQQLVQALAGGPQPGPHRRLPVAVEQRQPGRRAGWPGDRPWPHRRRHLFQQLGGGEDETDPRPGQPEEMVERAQHDQVGRLGRAGQRRQAFFRRRVDQAFIDDQPAAALFQLFCGVNRNCVRMPVGAQVVRVGEQYVRRRGRQRARQGGVLQQARTMAELRPRLDMRAGERADAGDDRAWQQRRQQADGGQRPGYRQQVGVAVIGSGGGFEAVIASRQVVPGGGRQRRHRPAVGVAGGGQSSWGAGVAMLAFEVMVENAGRPAPASAETGRAHRGG